MNTVNGGFLFFLSLFYGHVLFAAPPLKPDAGPQGATCFFNKEAARRNQAFQTQSKPHPKAFPLPRNPKVLVIRVDFTDRSMTFSKAQTEAFFSQVQRYFSENSFGAFIPDFTVSTNVHTLGTMATYGADCGGNVACHDDELQSDTIQAEASVGTDFTIFDHIMIYHAGEGQETSNVTTDIWSLYFPLPIKIQGKDFEGFTIVPEQEAGNASALGVVCHEYGHQLGLPDLYDTAFSGGRSTVGVWDIMDYPYAEAPGEPLGGNPTHLGAWSKKFLGFITPQIFSSSGTVALTAVEVTSSILQIPLPVSDVGSSNEFLLVEYRNINSTATYDKGLPGSGILVWHIDETIASDAIHIGQNNINSVPANGSDHRGVELLEADFTESYLNNGGGEATDAYTANATLAPPATDANNGLGTGIVMTGFSGLGSTNATFLLDIPTIRTLTANQVGFSTTISTNDGFVQLEGSPASFGSGTSIFLGAPSNLTFTNMNESSFVSQLSKTGVGVLVGAQSNAQPQDSVALTIGFSGNAALASLSDANKNKLSIARFDSRHNVWVPVESQVNLISQTVSASLSHFSLFQIMQVNPAPTTSSMHVFPNPMRPSRGPSYAQMTFSNTPPGARIKIYSIKGELIRSLQATSVGVALWDGRNNHGMEVSSGVYLAHLEKPDGEDQKIIKVAIER